MFADQNESPPPLRGGSSVWVIVATPSREADAITVPAIKIFMPRSIIYLYKSKGGRQPNKFAKFNINSVLV